MVVLTNQLPHSGMIRAKDEPNRHLHVCRENADGKRDTPRILTAPTGGFDESRQSQTIGWLADWRLDGETHHEACAYRSAVKTVASRASNLF